ncbi:1-pyrroline-5-carboxylate dehydrogenase [Psychrobacter ciconiae]|uniref:1-pyrroline-5-carboxylate dehydrogenase n=1 Tax=Psychrobacter ciconiae TaxID=1553449 RepID=UPI001918C8B0|nr:1-pyrroline-5-carboxylate dehydrogenase [Psychrobacter ciconiae]
MTTNNKVIENWRLMTAAERRSILQNAAADIVKIFANDKNFSQKAEQLLNQIFTNSESLDDVRRLTGATGESNDWYVRGRGKTLVMAGENANFLAVLGQLIAALITGNEVVFHCSAGNGASFDGVSAQIVAELHSAGVPDAVLTLDNYSQTYDLLQQSDLMQVAISADIQEVLAISADLAKLDGALVQVIAITNDNERLTMLTTDYLYRFVTERVKTVNTTAIGGNASLLELAAESL